MKSRFVRISLLVVWVIAMFVAGTQTSSAACYRNTSGTHLGCYLQFDAGCFGFVCKTEYCATN